MLPIPNNDSNDSRSRYLTYEQMNLINTFRGASFELANMGRLMLVSMIFDTPCADVIFGRLIQNTELFYNTFSNYYSDETSEQVANLIGQGIINMRGLTEALKSKNEQEATSLLQQWQQSTNMVADLFASMNPFWVKEQWQNLLHRYVQLNYQQMLALLMEDCERALSIFDRIRALTVLMGDYMARGIMFGLTEMNPGMNQPGDNMGAK